MAPSAPQYLSHVRLWCNHATHLACKHFKEEDSHAPPVCSLIMPPAKNNFRGHVLKSATHRVWSSIFTEFLCKAKVGEHGLEMRAKKDMSANWVTSKDASCRVGFLHGHQHQGGCFRAWDPYAWFHWHEDELQQIQFQLYRFLQAPPCYVKPEKFQCQCYCLLTNKTISKKWKIPK